MDVLIPDLDAVEEVDIVRLQLEAGLTLAERLLKIAKTEKQKKECEKQIAEAREGLADLKPDPDLPCITIGFIDPSKRLGLFMMADEKLADLPEPSTKKKLTKKERIVERRNTLLREQAYAEVAEEWARWGVKGHRNFNTSKGEVVFETEKESLRGQKVKVASRKMVTLYREMGLLFDLRDRIVDYNSLSAKKKSRSSPTSGDVTPTSGAGDAKKTRT